MKISSLFSLGRPTRSFEVFPPKRDGDVESIYRAFDELRPLKPDYISVTYGAGGSNAGLHYEINAQLEKSGIPALAHFTCVGQSKDQIAAQLEKLAAAGVQNVLALRGDPPKGAEKFERPKDGFGYADELIAFIKGRFDFCIGAACYPEVHPEAESAASDLENLRRKVDAGADFLVTQMFFDNAAYFRFLEAIRSAGIKLPVIPGIMPVLTPKFFAREWGVKFPQGFKEGFTGQDAEADEAYGIEFAARQCRELLAQGAPGLHLYTMNKAQASLKIYKALGA